MKFNRDAIRLRENGIKRLASEIPVFTFQGEMSTVEVK
jgi:hypothetical protein